MTTQSTKSHQRMKTCQRSSYRVIQILSSTNISSKLRHRNSVNLRYHLWHIKVFGIRNDKINGIEHQLIPAMAIDFYLSIPSTKRNVRYLLPFPGVMNPLLIISLPSYVSCQDQLLPYLSIPLGTTLSSIKSWHSTYKVPWWSQV